MKRFALFSAVAGAVCFGSVAQPLKLPLDHDEDKGTVYVAPNVSSTEKSMKSDGATIGVQRPSGRSYYSGVDTSGSRPTYSIGGETGGSTSFSAGVHSDGDKNTGAKAGITIKY